MKILLDDMERNENLAPVVLFTYNRLSHVKKTIESLEKNDLAPKTELYIFSDGYKGEKDRKDVLEIRSFLNEISNRTSFKKVKIFFNKENKGLAKNIISGVSDIIKEYSKVIVIEDDVLTSEDFLSFMNDALNFYRSDRKVWSIGGYTHPMNWKKDYSKDIYAVCRCSSYCWATWKDRWDKIDWEIKDYKRFKYNFFKRRRFNQCGNDMSAMLDAQMKGKINSWAIRFDYNMWKNNMINVLPVKSKANNIGHDGSGTHANIDLSERDKFYCRIEKSNYMLEPVSMEKSIVKEYRKIFHCSLWVLLKGYIINL